MKKIFGLLLLVSVGCEGRDPEPRCDPPIVYIDGVGEVITSGGRVAIREGTWSGTIPAGEFTYALGKGYRPETRQEYCGRLRDEARAEKTSSDIAQKLGPQK